MFRRKRWEVVQRVHHFDGQGVYGVEVEVKETDLTRRRASKLAELWRESSHRNRKLVLSVVSGDDAHRVPHIDYIVRRVGE